MYKIFVIKLRLSLYRPLNRRRVKLYWYALVYHYAVPVQDLKHLKTTAIQITLASKPVKILAVYLSPSRPLVDSDLSSCLRGGLSVLMVGDLNAKHMN
jgi:hypothetical protein